MKLIFKISVATLLSLVSTVFVANADAGSDENAQTEQSLKKLELDLKGSFKRVFKAGSGSFSSKKSFGQTEKSSKY